MLYRDCLFVLAMASPAFAAPPARVDVFGDPLPPGAIARLGTNRLRHALPITHADFRHDGLRFAAYTQDGFITISDAETGKLLRRIDLGIGYFVRYHRTENKLIAYSPYRGIRVFDDETGRLIRSTDVPVEGFVESRNDYPSNPSWISDDLQSAIMLKYVPRAEFSPIIIVNPLTGQVKNVLPLKSTHNEPLGLEVSRDGSRFLINQMSSSRTQLHIYDMATAKPIGQVIDRPYSTFHQRFSPDGKKLLTHRSGLQDEYFGEIVDLENGQVLKNVDGLRQSMIWEWSPDGQSLIGVGTDSSIINRKIGVWDLKSKSWSREFPDQEAFWPFIVSPTGHRIAMTGSTMWWQHKPVRIVDLRDGKIVPDPKSAKPSMFMANSGFGSTIQPTFLPNSHRIVTYSVKLGEPTRTSMYRNGDKITYQRDRHFTDYHARMHSIWDAETGTVVDQIMTPFEIETVLAISPDGSRLLLQSPYDPNRNPKKTRYGNQGETEYRAWDRHRDDWSPRYGTHDSFAQNDPFTMAGDNQTVWVRTDRIEVIDEHLGLDSKSRVHKSIERWDAATLKKIDRFEIPPDTYWYADRFRFAVNSHKVFYCFSISPKEKPQQDGIFRQFDIESKTEGPTMRWATAEELKDDDRRSERMMRYWDVTPDGRWLATLQHFRDPPPPPKKDPFGNESNFEWMNNPTGRSLVTLFDTTTGAVRTRFPIHLESSKSHLHPRFLSISPDGRLVAVSGGQVGTRLYETISGRIHWDNPPRKTLTRSSYESATMTNDWMTAFSSDGELFLRVGSDDAPLVYRVDELGAEGKAASVTNAWEALLADDVPVARAGQNRLRAEGDAAVTFLATHLKPATALTEADVRKRIDQLSAQVFADREEAEQWLVKNASGFQGVLEKVRKESRDLEIRTRIDRIRPQLTFAKPTPDDMRNVRAVEVLERIGTPAARQLLKRLALGPAEAWLTKDAQAAWGRLTAFWPEMK